MKQIAIIGAGGFGREVAMLIEQINESKPQWEFVGYFDDGQKKGKIINGYPVLGGIEELNSGSNPLAIVFAIGNPLTKKKIHTAVTNSKISYPVLIHPNVQIGNKRFNTIGEGCIISSGNILTVNIEIGNHVILNLSCTIGHDTIIKDYSSLMPGINVSGEVIIHESVYIGTGVKIINQVEIGHETIIGAGAVVSKSLPEKCTAVGIPAKPIKFH